MSNTYAGYRKGANSGGGFVRQVSSKLTVTDVLQFPILGYMEDINGVCRNIRKETCEHFGVRTELDMKTGQPVAAYCPVTKKGKLTGYLRCNLMPTGKDDKWSVVGEVGINCDLLGQHAVGSARKTSYITEGFWDLLSCWQVMMDETEEKYQSFISVVSIGFGTANAVAHCATNQEFLNSYSKIVTVMDNDHASAAEKKKGIMKGNEATNDLSLFFNGKAEYAALKTNYDPSDYLQEGSEKELYWALRKPVKWSHTGVVSGVAVSMDDINRPIPKGFSVSFLPKLSAKMDGFRPNELTILASLPKQGKTLIARQIFWEAKKAGMPVMGMFLEESLIKTYQAIICLDYDIPVEEFRKNPSMLSDEKKSKSLTNFFDDNTLLVSADKGLISVSEFLDMVRFGAARLPENSLIILDHLSYIIGGEDTKDERKAIDMVLTELSSIVKSYKTHIICISHVNHNPDRGVTKNKDGSIIYPYIYNIESTDPRSSKSFSMLANNMVGINPEITADGTRGVSIVRLLMSRENGDSGNADTIIRNKITGKMVAIG